MKAKSGFLFICDLQLPDFWFNIVIVYNLHNKVNMNDLDIAQKYLSKEQNARTRGIEFSLSFTSMRNLCKAKRCYYTGVLLTEKRKGKAFRGTDRTIDRVDSTVGYVPGNVVACCHAANNLKAFCEESGGAITSYKQAAQVFGRTLSHIQKRHKTRR